MIKNQIIKMREAISQCENRYGRTPGSVTLLAVSKKQSIEKIKIAMEAGQVAFGENYIQEALPKIMALSNQPIEWHFIGALQRNKTQKIADHFHWVHSLSEASIAERLNHQRPVSLSPLNVCIQVNIDRKNKNSGVAVEALPELAALIASLPQLTLRGLMTLPTPTLDFKKQCAVYQTFKNIFLDLQAQGFALDTLSMGMSDDYEAAISKGATIIRIGSAIFGMRE